MKILITGANGFIGQRIVQRWQNQFKVIGSGRRQPTNNQIPNFRSGDITNAADCDVLVEDIDIVIHCAGKAGAWGDWHSYALANITGTENLLQSCKQANVKRFINISSPSIYFDYKDQFDLSEDQIPQKFSNAYAETKYIAEQKVQAAHSEAMQTVSLRPRGVIGAGDRNWLPRIIDMRKNDSLIQPGKGKNLVDFTSVENLIDVIESCIHTNPENLGRIFNVTNGQPENLWSFVEKSLQSIGLDGKRKKVPTALAMLLARCSESYHKFKKTKTEPKILPVKVGVAAYSMTLDISAAEKYLNYQPKVTTDQAIVEFAKWWMDQQ